MKITEFNDLLTDRYPQLLSKDALHNDIIDFIDHYSDHNRSKIWDHFVNTYEKASPPFRATFN